MNKLTKAELHLAQDAGEAYATEVIVDLNDYNEDSVPEISWEDYHSTTIDAFMAGAMCAKQNLIL